MSHNFSRSQIIAKPVATGDGGVVAAQHVRAAEIGAQVLEAGGDAADAAVAVSYAIGVLEPWMSGPAGGGALTLWREKEQRAYALWYGMRSPVGLDVANYPLDETGRAADLFPWRCVQGDRNVRGPHAIAVPGLVAGTQALHNRFGRMGWAELLQPAIEEARRGMLVDWYAALVIAAGTRWLADDPDAAALFLEEGRWPTISGWTALAEKRLDQSALADTLTRLAEAGAQDFYTGEIARHMVGDVQSKGCALALEDLAAYAPVWRDAQEIAYRGARLFAAGDLTAGPTLAHALAQVEKEMPGSPLAPPDARAYTAYADSLKAAYRERLATMGDQDAPHAPSCTTHFSIVDQEGNMVSMTQTLLSLFGSSVVSGSTGLLMNNGIMWFDPEPGHPNSLAAGKRCLMNVCPVVGEKEGRRWAVGASGGRKIMPAVMQLSAFLGDYGMTLEEAFHHPRIDASGGDVIVADEALSAEVITALSARHPLAETKRTSFPYAFACPAGVMREGQKVWGCTEVMSPWGDAAYAKRREGAAP